MKLAIEKRLLALRIQSAALTNIIERRSKRHASYAFVQDQLELLVAKLIQEEMKIQKREIKRAA